MLMASSVRMRRCWYMGRADVVSLCFLRILAHYKVYYWAHRLNMLVHKFLPRQSCSNRAQARLYLLGFALALPVRPGLRNDASRAVSLHRSPYSLDHPA